MAGPEDPENFGKFMCSEDAQYRRREFFLKSKLLPLLFRKIQLKSKI